MMIVSFNHHLKWCVVIGTHWIPFPIVFDAITDLLGNKLRLTMDETLYKLKYTSNDWYYVGY